MGILQNLFEGIQDLVPAGLAAAGVVIVVWMARLILARRDSERLGSGFRAQMATLVLSIVGLVVIILALPISEGTAGQLLSLLGILLSAAIALSATTFVGNIMAGLMLRSVRNFRSGDFIRVGEYFGRVSDRGLFHVEIQTEDRDLTTLPNLYLVTNPVKVVRSSGTLITAEVSLGYDLPRQRIEQLLLKSAGDAALQEPFVHIMELGDFSVTYRIAGLLTEVKSLLSTRSRLHECMLDRLHRAGVEIVSPTFMNQRVVPDGRRFVPEPEREVAPAPPVGGTAEALVFDKAEEAASLENLLERRDALTKEVGQLKAHVAEATNEPDKASLQQQIDSKEILIGRLTEYIKKRQERESGG